jgi:hypothetical protein
LVLPYHLRHTTHALQYHFLFINEAEFAGEIAILDSWSKIQIWSITPDATTSTSLSLSMHTVAATLKRVNTIENGRYTRWELKGWIGRHHIVVEEAPLERWSNASDPPNIYIVNVRTG